MNTNEQLISKFYTAFGNNDISQMATCYHKDIVFQDPAFGILKERDPILMWKMLLERSNGNIKINAEFEFEDGLIIKHTDRFGVWKWSHQALGLKGLLLGWTSFMRNKIQESAQLSLKKYIEKQ
jgi:hypothetical protein